MKRAIGFVGLVAAVLFSGASAQNQWPYDPSPLYPFGAPNPTQTDPEARIFDPMIGAHNCTHQRTDYKTRDVSEADAVWAWYYDMNGHGVRDLYRFGEGSPASQRVYNPETKQWHIWYFIGQNFYYANEWVGGADGDRLVFEADDEFNGREIRSRLEYYDITDTSFEWKSTNIDKETGEEFVDWTISCKRRQ